jgi:peptide/nickel transport system permease protein
MTSYVVRRLLQTVLTVLLVSIITFLLFWSSAVRPAREICNYNCNTERSAEIERT